MTKREAEPTAEDALWAQYTLSRSSEAANALLEFYLPWITAQATRFLRVRDCLQMVDDAVSEVAIRFLRNAIPGFDPARGLKPKTYLVPHVRGAILDMLRDVDPFTRGRRAAHNATQGACSKLSQELGRRPTDAEIANHLAVPEANVISAQQELEGQGKWPDNLPAGVDPDERAKLGWGEPPATPPEPTMEIFDHATRMLRPRSRELLRLYYIEGLTMKQTAQQIGVSESRISQIHAPLMKFLKKTSSPCDFVADTP